MSLRHDFLRFTHRSKVYACLLDSQHTLGYPRIVVKVGRKLTTTDEDDNITAPHQCGYGISLM